MRETCLLASIVLPCIFGSIVSSCHGAVATLLKIRSSAGLDMDALSYGAEVLYIYIVSVK